MEGDIMQCLQVCVATAISFLLVACGLPSARTTTSHTTADITAVSTPQPLDSSPAVPQEATPLNITQQVDNRSSADQDVVRSLKERVAKASIIVIGEVTGTGEILNGARLPEDPTQPDPRVFVLNQVYHVQVQRYLKGTGPATLNVVQAEGFTSAKSGAVAIPTTVAEIAKLKATYEYVSISPGKKYLFFLDPLVGSDPAQNYMAGGLGVPWRFTLPETGNAQQESPVAEASQYFPELPSEAFIGQVEKLIHTP